MPTEAPPRSQQPDVRNPILGLPAALELADLLQDQPELSQIFQRLLRELSAQADQKAEQSWTSHKPPMAAYWKAAAVYTRHIVKAIRLVSARTKRKSDQEGMHHVKETTDSTNH
jgi:hypothetical protein